MADAVEGEASGAVDAPVGTTRDGAGPACPHPGAPQAVAKAMPNALHVESIAAQSRTSRAGIHASNVSWTTGGGFQAGPVLEVPKSGGTPVTLAANQNAPYENVVDGTSAYWTNYGDGCHGPRRSLVAMQRASACRAPVSRRETPPP